VRYANCRINTITTYLSVDIPELVVPDCPFGTFKLFLFSKGGHESLEVGLKIYNEMEKTIIN
jgi:hypothetical protein